MDVNEQVARVRSVIGDSAGTFVTDNDIIDWLNEAQQDLAQRLLTYQGEATGTWSGTSLTLPTGLIEVTSLRLGTADDIEFVNDDIYWGWKDAAASPDHSIARVFNGVIEVYPTPDTGTEYRIRYYKEPTDVSAGGTSALNADLHVKMVRYAQAMAHQKENNDGQSDRYMAMYLEGLPPAPLGRTRLQPGPFHMVPEAGPFDVLDSTHF